MLPMQEWDTSPHPVNPFSKRHYLFWGFINLLPLALAPAIRNNFFLLGSMFLFASTIKGYLYGVALPRPLKLLVHPLVVCFLYSSGCIALWAYLTQLPYMDILEMYLPGVRCASAESCSSFPPHLPSPRLDAVLRAAAQAGCALCVFACPCSALLRIATARSMHLSKRQLHACASTQSLTSSGAAGRRTRGDVGCWQHPHGHAVRCRPVRWPACLLAAAHRETPRHRNLRYRDHFRRFLVVLHRLSGEDGGLGAGACAQHAAPQHHCRAGVADDGAAGRKCECDGGTCVHDRARWRRVRPDCADSSQGV